MVGFHKLLKLIKEPVWSVINKLEEVIEVFMIEDSRTAESKAARLGDFISFVE